MDGHAAGPADLGKFRWEMRRVFDTCGEETLILTGESEDDGKKTVI